MWDIYLRGLGAADVALADFKEGPGALEGSEKPLRTRCCSSCGDVLHKQLQGSQSLDRILWPAFSTYVSSMRSACS